MDEACGGGIVWEYNEDCGLYFLNGCGIGITGHELQEMEEAVEYHEIRKRQRIAEAQEY